MLLARKVYSVYSVDFNRATEDEWPPLFDAVRCDRNKPIVDWLVHGCGQDVGEVHEGTSVHQYAVECAAGNMASWLAENYP